jgi:hypothetical protein
MESLCRLLLQKLTNWQRREIAMLYVVGVGLLQLPLLFAQVQAALLEGEFLPPARGLHRQLRQEHCFSP